MDDLINDPDVQNMLEKYDDDNDYADDSLSDPYSPDDEEIVEEEDDHEDKEKEESEPEEIELNDPSLDEFIEEAPELDFTPQTEYAKSLGESLEKIDDGLARYELSRIEPLAFRGEDGKTIYAFDATNLPDDFKYENDRQAQIAAAAFQKIQNEYDKYEKEYNEIVDKQNDLAKQQESSLEDYGELEDMIKEGILPAIVLNKDNAIDVDDPGNQLIDDIMSYKNQWNEEHNRDISLETAISKFRRENPGRFEGIADDDLGKEDKSRSEYATRSRSSARTGASNHKIDYTKMSDLEWERYINSPKFNPRELL